MFRFFIFLLLPFLLQGQDVIHVISYNIRLDTESDGKDQWDNRKEGVASFLINEDADFVGLQEVLANQLDFLDSAMLDYKYLGVGRDDGKRSGEFSPIFYNTRKWKPVNSQFKWLSETPDTVSRGWDAACNRVVTYVLFENLESGNTVAVFNTHFDHVGKIARENSAKLIQEWAQNFTEAENIVVTGDFNLTDDTPLYEILTQNLKDSRKNSLAVSEDHPGTYNGFELKGEFKRRIDYIFVSPEMKVLSYISPDIRINDRHVSDHFPVIINVELAK